MKMAQLIPLDSVPIYLNPIALRKTKIAYNFGLSECNMDNSGRTLTNIICRCFHFVIHQQETKIAKYSAIANLKNGNDPILKMLPPDI